MLNKLGGVYSPLFYLQKTSYITDMISEIKSIAEETLHTLDMYSDDALSLVMRTGWAESGYRALKGATSGNPALGFWQVEPVTAKDTLDNYVKFRPSIKEKLLYLGLNESNLEFCLLSNIALQVAFCRLKYRRDSKPIPPSENIEEQAKYWKRVYNTELGKGTVAHFLQANK